MSDYIKRSDVLNILHGGTFLAGLAKEIQALPSADVVERSEMESYAGYAYDCGYEKGLEDCQNCEHRREKGEWIPCEERLPEHTHPWEAYLITFGASNIVAMACYRYGRWELQGNDLDVTDAVKAWMLKPQPYEGRK